MSLIRQIFGHGRSQVGSRPNEFYPINAKMGLELEVENLSAIDIPDHVEEAWSVIADNSLRDGGREFVHRRPLYGPKLVDSLKVLSEFLQTTPARLSHRCSLHCHIDFRDRTPEEVEKFFLLYMLVEPALYTVSNKDRYNNIYCPGLSHTTELVKDSACLFFGGNMDSLVNNWEKYTGINLQALGTLGSVEIRTHSGSMQFEDLYMWTKLLNCLYKACIDLSKEDINKLSSPEDLAELFTPDLKQNILCDNMYQYWDNARLNLVYYNLVPKAAERANVATPSPSNFQAVLRPLEEIMEFV